ncbi:FAD-dependent oxidoreductase [Haloactinomyces albus]|uniref:3-oxosteroid 1-dehydrogenase n=1 Tax=Haloactinomyces albus TaxID=1352928 RepID=A0AAE4CN93_9ACTN|nr:FAD-dependent oxidoreductase [Haloactinomyces albus]MDR7300418.1 3-oxosteroid 1-dehydrogenase [Haloactinomyces albus]
MITTPLGEIPRTHDVVVIGSGAAGLVTAVRAADAGLSVLVLEKADRLGGTSAVGGGVMWAPCNHLMRRKGFRDSVDDAKSYLSAVADERMTAAEIDWYINTAPRAVEFLDERTHVRFTPLARPDYHPEWPGASTGGRGLDNEPFDPTTIPGLAELLRKPTYLPPISMNERDALRGAPIDPELLAERRRTGVRTMGGALVGRLVLSAVDRDVGIVTSARVTGLGRTGDSAASAGRWTLDVNDGAATVRAANVVMASGGFEWNARLRKALLKFPITPISAPSNEGDGLVLGMRAGAALDEMTAIWGVPVIAPPTQRYDGRQSGRMGNVEMTLPGSVTVNAKGARFVNEATNYHDLNRVFGNVDPATGHQENNPAWLVFDQAYLDKYSIAGSTPGVAEDWMVSAGSAAELAHKCGIDPSGLAATLERFNADAEFGVDTEFDRGASTQDRHLGDPANTPNPCLAPVRQEPLYAVPISAGALGTAGGLKADLQGRVLGNDEDPIPGFFAAGNCSATVFHDAYPGGGATLGSAITRGFAIGEHLAATHACRGLDGQGTPGPVHHTAVSHTAGERR